MLVTGDQQRIRPHRDGVDLGGPAMARIARDYGYTLAELRKLLEGLVTSVLCVALFFGEEADNWHYRVPAPHINGGRTPTREDAGRDALSAIAFALSTHRGYFERVSTEAVL